MKILISAYAFAPSVGGIETSTRLLASEFLRRGHQVQIITHTKSDAKDGIPFPIHRRPTPQKQIKLLKWCDIYWHNNLSLRYAWPLFIIKKPWFITHQTWLSDASLKSRMLLGLKKWICGFAKNFTLSHALQKKLGHGALVIGNPYDEKVFYPNSEVTLELKMIYVGRLVSDKGVDLILKAIANLMRKGFQINLSIVGDGPERDVLKRLAYELKIEKALSWLGVKHGVELAELYQKHKIAVIPSRWEEPFGIVALEAIACGCVVIGSFGGGLPEAINGCGLMFKNGDAEDLTNQIMRLLKDPDLFERLKKPAPEHLKQFTIEKDASQYLREFERKLS